MSTTYSRYFTALADYNAGNPIDDRDLDGEFDAMTVALNRKVLCSGSAPSSPINGQTWVDTTNKLLKMYRSNEWVTIGGVHIGTSAMSTPQEGDGWYDTTNNVLKFYNGTGWVTAGLNINGLTEKSSLVNADLLIIEDSEDSNAQKKVLWGNVTKVLQVVNTTYTGVSTTTSTIPNDDSIPQITEGAEFMSLAITPKSATSKLIIDVIAQVAADNADWVVMALFQNLTANAINACSQYETTTGGGKQLRMFHVVNPSGNTAPNTFRIRCGRATAGTLTFNGTAGGRLFGGLPTAQMTITEVAAT